MVVPIAPSRTRMRSRSRRRSVSPGSDRAVVLAIFNAGSVRLEQSKLNRNPGSRAAALRRLSSVVEQTADHIIITDRTRHIEYVNPAFERQPGSSTDFAPSAARRCPPNCRTDRGDAPLRARRDSLPVLP
ncbi:MAG: PAS domain-containing protein [Verrucomicrobia bacterium]|nr:PAS domain-containing protein [Verrucomicrobiota bacterium]